jgi:flap endonuclease-1
VTSIQTPLTHQGNEEEVEKYSRRLVKVLPQHNEDCKTLLTLMGVPHITVCDFVS